MPKPNDIWGLGVCIYTYLFETLPFNGESDIEVQIATKNNPLEFKEGISEEAKDLLNNLLNKDPLKRYTVSQLKSCKWFTV